MQDHAFLGARNKARLAHLLNPSPANILAFLDVSQSEINDGMFVVLPLGYPGGDRSWNDVPADRHNRAANLSFVDGHVETHRWRWPKANFGTTWRLRLGMRNTTPFPGGVFKERMTVRNRQESSRIAR